MFWQGLRHAPVYQLAVDNVPIGTMVALRSEDVDRLADILAHVKRLKVRSVGETGSNATASKATANEEASEDEAASENDGSGEANEFEEEDTIDDESSDDDNN